MNTQDLIALLEEIRQHFTRDDDLPDNLLPRIDAALAARQLQPAASLREQEDAEMWREHCAKLDALVTYCPTCCQGFTASAEMPRDELIFECGKTAGRAQANRDAQRLGREKENGNAV